MAKKTKTVVKRGMAIEDDEVEEDDSEDEYEEVEETPITKAAEEAVKGGERPDEEGWCTISDNPPDTIVQIETSGQKRDGIKRDGVWYQRPDDWKPEDTHTWAPEPVQITRWRPKPE